LQRLIQPPQLADFRRIAEIEARPALAQDEAVRVIRNFAQRLDVAAGRPNRIRSQTKRKP
jgi:hypothetical protein